MRRRSFRLILLTACLFGIPLRAGCNAPLPIFVSIPPAQYLVEKIGGAHVEVQVLVGAGRTPHTFEPTPRQIVALSRAKAFFTIGLPFESQIATKILGVDTGLIVRPIDAGIRKRVMEHGQGHQHLELDDDIEQEGFDPHIWLAPALVKQLAGNICDALCDMAPDTAEEFRENLAAFEKEIDATDEDIREILEPYHGRRIVTFHPAFGYFCDAYGLKQVAVELAGKSPTPKQQVALIEQAKVDAMRVIFVQPQFDTQFALTIASAIGGKVVPLDSLEKDILANLRSMAERMAEALDESSGSPEGGR